MSDATETTVVRNDEKGRYEILLDGTVAGFTEYYPDGDNRLVFPHTVIDPAFSGRGLGSTLVSQALADVASRQEAVVPVCPFVVKYLRENTVDGLDVQWRPTAGPQGSDNVDSADQ